MLAGIVRLRLEPEIDQLVPDVAPSVSVYWYSLRVFPVVEVFVTDPVGDVV